MTVDWAEGVRDFFVEPLGQRDLKTDEHPAFTHHFPERGLRRTVAEVVRIDQLPGGHRPSHHFIQDGRGIVGATGPRQQEGEAK